MVIGLYLQLVARYRWPPAAGWLRMKFIPSVILIAIGSCRCAYLSVIYCFSRELMKRFYLVHFLLIAIAGCSYNVLSSTSFFPSLPEALKSLFRRVLSPLKIKWWFLYAKYQLDNGLTVILSPDDSDPLVHVDVTIMFASAREEIGKSGLLTSSSIWCSWRPENVGDQQHFKIITEAGGSLNGTTNRDRIRLLWNRPI